MDNTCNSKNSSDKPTLHPNWKFIRSQYEPVKILGSGASGQVIKARNISTGDDVAIKHISDSFDQFYRTKLILREIQILKHLSAQRGDSEVFPFTEILDVLLVRPAVDFASEDGKSGEYSLFIVMEPMHTTLEALLERPGRSSLKEKHIKKMAYQILSGLKILHEAGIVHRDIKPSNILIDSHYNIKIADFGLSRTIEVSKIPAPDLAKKENRRQAKRRLSNHVVTRHYRAPEVILLEKEYDSGVDLWSFGCVLGQMLSCSRPYHDQGLAIKNKALFAGDACYPLSPGDHEDEENDQLNVILNAFGYLSRDDLSFIQDKNARRYTKQFINKHDEPINFRSEFYLSDPALVDIMSKVLEFNFYYRTPAKDLIKLEVFDDVRQESLDEFEIERAALSVDDPDAFDYESCKPTTVQIEELRNMLIEECLQL